LERIDEAIANGRRYQRPITSIGETRPHGTSARGPSSRWLSTPKPEKSCMSVPQDTDTEMVVYVRLLDEGTEVWRAVGATPLPGGTFPLQEPDDYDPVAETREFSPSTKVQCVTRKFADCGEASPRSHAPCNKAAVRPLRPVRAYDPLGCWFPLLHRCGGDLGAAESRDHGARKPVKAAAELKRA
jgi:hypothetical protein